MLIVYCIYYYNKKGKRNKNIQIIFYSEIKSYALYVIHIIFILYMYYVYVYK